MKSAMELLVRNMMAFRLPDVVVRFTLRMTNAPNHGPRAGKKVDCECRDRRRPSMHLDSRDGALPTPLRNRFPASHHRYGHNGHTAVRGYPSLKASHRHNARRYWIVTLFEAVTSASVVTLCKPSQSPSLLSCDGVTV
jgi:hypothetical protein